MSICSVDTCFGSMFDHPNVQRFKTGETNLASSDEFTFFGQTLNG